MRSNALIVLLAATAFAAVSPAYAQAQNGGAGEGRRDIPSQGGDRFIRLDSRTGAISSCSNTSGSGWACTTPPDERPALDGEIGRLEAENARLKSELARREATGTVPPVAKANEQPAKNGAKGEAENEASSSPVKSETMREPKSEAGVTQNNPATPSQTATSLSPATIDERSASAAVSADQGKVELQLPGSSETERKDGFMSRAWQQLLDLARMFSRG